MDFKRMMIFNTPLRMVSMAFTADEKTFLLAKDDGSLQIWRIGEPNAESVKLPTNIWRSAFTADGRMIAVNSEGGVVLWTISANPEKVSTLRPYAGAVSKLTFSEDSSLLLTVGLDKKIRVWNTDSGGMIQEFERLDETVSSIAFGVGNHTVIAGGQRGGVYVVDCELCRPFEEIKNLARKKNPRPLTPEEREEFMPGERTLPVVKVSSP